MIMEGSDDEKEIQHEVSPILKQKEIREKLRRYYTGVQKKTPVQHQKRYPLLKMTPLK